MTIPDASFSMVPPLPPPPPLPFIEGLEDEEELEDVELSTLCCEGRTTAVTIDVTCSSFDSCLLQEVGSERREIISEMPPVRSDNPSNVLPYRSASYDPCSLKEEELVDECRGQGYRGI